MSTNIFAVEDIQIPARPTHDAIPAKRIEFARKCAAIAKRLDRLSRQAERMERDQSIAIETLALFIRYYLTVSTPVPEAHQEAARALGKARFEQFTEQLGRHLMRGRSLVRDVVEELHPDSVRMEDAAAAAAASSSSRSSGVASLSVAVCGAGESGRSASTMMPLSESRQPSTKRPLPRASRPSSSL